MKNRRSRLAGLLPAVLVLSATVLLADGFIVIPRPPRPGPAAHFPLEVVRHDVRVEIDGPLATTTVDQEFFNPNPARLEGEYLFPLPAGAAIKNFSMWIDGHETRAELLDAVKARAIYEDIVRRLRDPALLEYDGRGVFRMRVFPIEPRGRKRIKISYHEVLEKNNGAVAYRYPLGTEKFSAKTIPAVSIVVNIHSRDTLQAIHCPTHAVTVARPAPGRATVSYSARDTLPQSDFRLFFSAGRERLGVSLLAFRPAGQEGFFFLSAEPNPAAGLSGKNPQDITFIVDTSGSMAGSAMEQTRRAIEYCLGRLATGGDRFNIVRFSSEAEPLFQGMAAASPDNLARAGAFVSAWQAAGGTNLEEALKLALQGNGAAGRSRSVVLITDGKPTIGETSEEALLRLLPRTGPGHSRIFPVAIGSEINTHLLDKMAEATGTFRTYIALGENIENGISRFYDRISSPVLCDVRLELPGHVRAFQVHPRSLPDLYRGLPLTVIGRYRGSGAATITVSGRVQGRAEAFTFHADFPAESLDHDFLPSLWAARRVGFLLDQIRLNGESKELIDEATRLARQYGIVTPYTSYLIVEDEKIRRDRGDLAETDMTMAGLPAMPALEQEQRREFTAMKDKSGPGSVRASTEFQKLNQTANVAAARAGSPMELNRQIRTVCGVAFYLNRDVWVDGRIHSKGQLPVTRIAFASEAFFALKKRQPQLAPLLALGRNVRFVSAGRVIEIFDAGATADRFSGR